ACRSAFAQKGVAHLTIPVDLQDEAVGKAATSKRNIPHHTSSICTHAPAVPNAEDLAHAANILNQAKRIVILAGRGAIGASDELETLAGRLGAVIIKALLGKMAIPDDSPYTTGGIGLLGTAPS